MNTYIIIGVFAVILFVARALLFKAGYENIGVDEFKTLAKDSSSLILDVRSPKEVKAGKIKGAKNINFNNPQFLQQIEKLDKSKKYLVYCRSGMRSAGAAAKMARAGFEEVYNLKGGYINWSRKG